MATLTGKKLRRTCITVFLYLGVPLLLLAAWGMDKTAERPPIKERQVALAHATGLDVEVMSAADFAKGVAPPDFPNRAGSSYTPSHNEDPAIPAQCWIETGYGTQNACKYCHTNYLAQQKHGNAFPTGEDQILYSFPKPGLNRIPWRNITHPEEITARLARIGVKIPHAHDPQLLDYVRGDNWTEAYGRARLKGDLSWNNVAEKGSALQLFPALNPQDLFPYRQGDPTSGGTHGYVDPAGFVRDKRGHYTGWRAVNFFPYTIFTPLTGSVSGIYLRLPKPFMYEGGQFNLMTYARNLDLLEANIKGQKLTRTHYLGDAARVVIEKGFYPVGTEFAHPLHYVDLNADGDVGAKVNGVVGNKGITYEFPGTRSKRVKEVRYLYKWKTVTLEEIASPKMEGVGGYHHYLGSQAQGWVDNGAGWILAAFIEDRKGRLRPQTTEELVQCVGCHSGVGNTVDAVWSFQRKLPGSAGWGEMNYGDYNEDMPAQTQLQDYENLTAKMGELGYFYYTVVGADLFGVMPEEFKAELMDYAVERNLREALGLTHSLKEIFGDDKLKAMERDARREILLERQKITRYYASDKGYLYNDPRSGKTLIKGTVFYPTPATMREKIASYYKIVLDQSFNLGKNSFGEQPEGIPFTFRSDGTVLDADRKPIAVGQVIDSRPWGEKGVGITPTGIVRVNPKGQPVDRDGKPVDVETHPERAVGHVSTGGTFDMFYNPILSDRPVNLLGNRRERYRTPSKR